MKRLRTVLTALALIAFASCEKEEKVEPAPKKVEQEEPKEYDKWYIQLSKDCEMTGMWKYKIWDAESRRIDSTYKYGACKLIKVADIYGDTLEGYWDFPMYAVDNWGTKRGSKE